MLDYFKKEIWQVRIETLPPWKRLWIRLLRIILLTSQGFTKSQIQQGAASLTYYSLLAIVPVIALLIGIARGFLFEKALESWLLEKFAEQSDIITKVFNFANASLENTKGGFIAGFGVLLFLWAAINILQNIEFVMNQIWEVKEGRSFAKRFTDYLAMMVLFPIIIFLANGISGYLSGSIALAKEIKAFEHAAPLLIPLLRIIPLFLTSLLFTFLNIFMPNTRVKILPAITAGVLTAIIYQLIQWAYFYFQFGVAKYNAIYGTFAAIPLFLIWLQLSWVVTLLGAKVAFAIQNVNAYEFISDIHLNHKFRTICSLRIAHLCIKNFYFAKPPLTIIEISNELSIPLSLTGKLVYQLVGAKVLIEAKREDDQETSFQPAQNIDQLTIKKIIDMIDERGEAISLPPSHELTLILKSLEKFSSSVQKSDGNILLKDI